MKTYFMSVIIILFASAILNANVIHVPDELPTIQMGIEKAQKEDTVLVAPGVYYENIDFLGKPITVASYYILKKQYTYITSTTIDGSENEDPEKGSVVSFVSGENAKSVLVGFTITGGSGTLDEKSQVMSGGGIALFNSGATIMYNRIEKNTIRSSLPSHGGGIGHWPPDDDSELIIEGNWLSYNMVVSDGPSSGGAINMYGNGRVVDNDFTYNTSFSHTSTTKGGGVSAWGKYSDASMQLLDNTFLSNKAVSVAYDRKGGYGGGLWIGEYRDSQIQGNRFQKNEVSSKRQSYGAGVMLSTMDASNKFCGNIIMLNSSTDVGDGNGGGVCLRKSHLGLYNNIICFNSSTYGGGLYIFGKYDLFHEQPGYSLFNNTIVSNKASIAGGGVFVAKSDPIMVNSIVWDNEAEQGAGIYTAKATIDIRFSNVQEGRDNNGNMSTDPLFTTSFFQLSDSSPCIGKGAERLLVSGHMYTCPSGCFMGNRRPTPVKSRPDMGAIEHNLGRADLAGFYVNDEMLPGEYSLEQNYPNPFNPQTTIKFSIPDAEFVTLKIYNSLGKEVATLISDNITPGNYTTTWDASGFASGVYYYRLETDQRIISTKKLILLK
jgi:hypothetical protein